MLGRLIPTHTTAAPEPERSDISLSQFARLLGGSYGGAYSPIPVSVQRALTHSASFACVDTLATSVSILPIDVVRKAGNIRVPVSPTPTLIAAPSAIVEQDVWLYQLMESMCTDGNGFGLITAVDALARPTSIELLDAGVVTNRKVVAGVPQATIGAEVHQLYPWGDLWHVPGKMVRAGSPFGESPVERAAATIGSAIAARDFGARFFNDGGHPGAVVTSDQELNPEQAQAIKAAIIQATRHSREPLVLGSGLGYEAVTVSPEDSQFIDLMRFAIEEACRFWRVPPSMVYAAISGQNVTYSNVSQADLHYLKYSLDGYLVRIERALSKLITRPQFVVFNRAAILRTDAETRWKVHDTRLRNKTTSVNEVRGLEDEAPIDDPAYSLPGIPGGGDPAPVAKP